MYRNYGDEDITISVVKTLLGSFIYLTTRHTFNSSEVTLKIPDFELFELLQVQRRRLIHWMSNCRQGALDAVMQTAFVVSSSSTGDLKPTDSISVDENRWSKIRGDRSFGRFAIDFSRPTPTATSSAMTITDTYERYKTENNAVGEVDDTQGLGLTTYVFLLLHATYTLF